MTAAGTFARSALDEAALCELAARLAPRVRGGGVILLRGELGAGKSTFARALLGALGFQWRETTADAVYQQANAVVPGTAGHGSLWTGMYVQLRADWIIAANLVGSVEAVHFQVGDSIRDAGGSNADYVGVELKYGW